MFRTYKYRLYPNEKQVVFIEKHFGCARFIYNLALETKIAAYSGTKTNLSAFDLGKQLTQLRKEIPWLKEVAQQTLELSIMNLDSAYKRFFKGASKFPVFKTKHDEQKFQSRRDIKIINDKLYLPKFASGIKTIIDRPLIGKIKSVTVSKTPTGKYFASIGVDTGEIIPAKIPVDINSAVGIDLGIKVFLSASAGYVVDNPRHLKKSLAKIKFLQRQVSKKVKGSNNRKKSALKLARQHEKVANQRKDFLQKLSTKLIRENQTICIEDLSSANLLMNHNISQSISDAGWGMFVSMLEYKSDWYGKNLLKIGRFEPSSKICSDCGVKNETLLLAHREWVCASCGVLHDRDFNAAKNIRNMALVSMDCTLKKSGGATDNSRGCEARDATSVSHRVESLV